MAGSKSTRKDQHKAHPVRRVAGVVAMGMMVAAVWQELRKPADEREWHGQLLSVVPYDLRPPSMARLQKSFWAPETSSVFVPRAFGVGWNINLAALWGWIQRALG